MATHRTRRTNQFPLGAAQWIFLLYLAFLLDPFPTTRAATITVDEITCTLIDAIESANMDTGVGGCAAGSGADTIELAADVTLTNVNNSDEGDDIGLPVIASVITLVGNDFTIERDVGAPPFSLFWVASEGTLSLNDLTLRHGARAISNFGTLHMARVNVLASLLHGIVILPGGTAHINDCFVSDNLQNGIIVLDSTVYVADSIVSGNGFFGILGSRGAVNVTRSIISHNQLSGVRSDDSEIVLTNSEVLDNLRDGINVVDCTVYVTDSTVAGNGFYGILGSRGAVNVTRSNISQNSFTGLRLDYSEGLLTNSTVSGNLRFGVNTLLSSIDILHSTLSGNERGLSAYLDSSVSVRLGNSIFANSEPGRNCSSTPAFALTDLGSNFADDHTCGLGFINIIPGVDYDVVLADNGGPTQTHALLPGSVAIDAGSDECPSTDQRGVDRPQDGDEDGVPRCDAGSFEYKPPAIIVSVDVKPDSYPNSINSNSRGVIPVAILGSDTFDVADVDVTTLAFGPGGTPIAHLNGHLQDVNYDGIMDLMTHYRTRETGIVCGDESATLTGETLDGQPIEGSDSIQTVGCRVTRRPAIWMKDQDRPDTQRRNGPIEADRK